MIPGFIEVKLHACFLTHCLPLNIFFYSFRRMICSLQLLLYELRGLCAVTYFRFMFFLSYFKAHKWYIRKKGNVVSMENKPCEYKIQILLVFFYLVYPVQKHIDGSQMHTVQTLYIETVTEREKKKVENIFKAELFSDIS